MPKPPKPSDREPSPRHKEKGSKRSDFERAVEAVRQLSNQELEPSDLTQYELETGSERGDRGAAILMAADLENALQSSIARLLRIPPKHRSELFGLNGPIGTFSYKVRIAHAISIFGDVTRRNLDIIRNIRNAFAHARRPIRFTNLRISALCDYLVVPRLIRPRDLEFLSALEEIPESLPRKRYRDVCTNLAFNLIAWNSRAPFIISHQALPFDLPQDYEVSARQRPLP
jgi:hypothetical protein